MKKVLARFVRQSPAMVVAMIALFVALSGTAVATTSALIGSAQIRNNSITGLDVKNKSLTAKDFKGSVRGARGAAGSPGPVGAQGIQGPPGAPNPNADTLDGIDSTGFVGAGQVRADGNVVSADIDNFTSAAFTSVISKSFTAPTAGFLLVIGSISAADDGSLAGFGELWFRLRLDATAINSGTFPYTLDYESDSEGDSGSASAVVPVTAGAHTVHLDAKDVAAGSYIYQRDVSVLFVPAGSGVAIPAALSRHTATSPQ